jgi:exodeoxyribonuclease VII large subunit
MVEQLNLFGSSEALPYTVSQLVARIRDVVESDADLHDLRVEGEVSNFRQASSGHCYFTLKDAGAELRCVMWRSAAQELRSLPSDGAMVLAHGRVGVYEQRGSIQLYVEYLEPSGVGALYREFELLKARLEEEGLFALDRKRALPRFPRRVGVVTSPTAAAFRDVLNVLRRRYPLVEVVLSPTMVQGESAPTQIVAALESLDACDDIDVILIVRGGGALEELWAFNDERVARAVAASKVPLVCGVGHETDFSLADFAADLRAPTPSAAAELATPDRAELLTQVNQLSGRLAALLRVRLNEARWALTEQEQALQHLSPATLLAQARQRVDDLAARAADLVEHDLLLRRERLTGLNGRLEGTSPVATLERGYAILSRQVDQQMVLSVSQVDSGDGLVARVSDGEFEVTVD